jgi:Ca2+-transporting ATPase
VVISDARPVLGAPALRGLTEAEASERLRRDGPNVVVPDRHDARWRRWLKPLSDPMLVLLLVAAPTYLAIGDELDAIITFAAVVPIALVGLLLEGRAERTLDQLRRMTAPTAVVVRDGVERSVPTQEIVVGDQVMVREGDVVPADARVLDAPQLLVDESSLTGESLPVSKATSGSEEETAVWAGTTVLSGRGAVEVVATGARTRYAAIGALVAGITEPSTPLQRSVRRLVLSFAVVAAVFVVAVGTVELVRGHGWARAVIAGVSLAIAALPEEFPMVYTLYLGLGAWRLAREKALVRRLPGVETLGATTVICTDKTGTLTEGRLAVGDQATVDGTDVAALLEAAVLASEPDPFDPLDLAIVAHAAAVGIDVAHLHRATLVADHPFDPVDKYLTHVWRMDDGMLSVASKGSLEGVLAHATATPEQRAEAMAAHERFAVDGMRVIAIARGVTTAAAGSRAEHEAGLSLAGLVAFTDPVREGVAEALADCRTAGIRVVMITGDHPSTAHAVAEALDLPHTDAAGDDRIATGDDIDRADEAQLDEMVRTTNAFARTRPEHKHRLVASLRRQGEVVAMTGDGINDAPALREADIGVAMGERGTEVARAAATIVLLDDKQAKLAKYFGKAKNLYKCAADKFVSPAQRKKGWTERVRSISMNAAAPDVILTPACRICSIAVRWSRSLHVPEASNRAYTA